MGGWKSKLVFLIVVYFAGYATAIHNTTPGLGSSESEYQYKFSKDDPWEQEEQDSLRARLDSDTFGQSVNAGVLKCMEITKQVGTEVYYFIKQKIDAKLEERAQLVLK